MRSAGRYKWRSTTTALARVMSFNELKRRWPAKHMRLSNSARLNSASLFVVPLVALDFLQPSGVLLGLAAALALLVCAYVVRRRQVSSHSGDQAVAATRMMPRRGARSHGAERRLGEVPGTAYTIGGASQRTTAPKYPPPPLDATLTWTGGDSADQNAKSVGAHENTYALKGAAPIRIGRERDNDIAIPDPTVHRYHAMIQRSTDAGYTISDLSSDRGNGIVLNGRRVTNARLDDGDTIKLGVIAIVFSFNRGNA